MSTVYPTNPRGPDAYVCAQNGCQVCLDGLIRQHEGLVHVVLRRQARGGVAYKDLLQEGRIGLWQAVLHFTLAAIGQQFGVSREMARHWRNDGLLLLRLPAFSGRLRRLCGQDSRPSRRSSFPLYRTCSFTTSSDLLRNPGAQ